MKKENAAQGAALYPLGGSPFKILIGIIKDGEYSKNDVLQPLDSDKSFQIFDQPE